MLFLRISFFFMVSSVFAAELCDNQIAWRHLSNNFFSQFVNYHFAPDVIATENHSALLTAKFTYSFLSKDLQDELVEIWLDSCSGIKKLGEQLTDDHGVINFVIPKDLVPPKGTYKVFLRVVADNAYVETRLFVLQVGDKLTIFDLDNTLTAGFEEMVYEVIDYWAGGDYKTKMRTGAVDLTKYWAHQKQALLVYLTGRHYTMSNFTNDWLISNKFPLGAHFYPLLTSLAFKGANSNGTFKLSYLLYLKGLGLDIIAAYGDEKTDLDAFLGAQIPNEKIYMIESDFDISMVNKIDDNLLVHIKSLKSL